MRLFDLHCDTLSFGLDVTYSVTSNNGHVDLTRGAVYAPWVQTFAAFLPDSVRGKAAVEYAKKLFSAADRWTAQKNGFHLLAENTEMLGCSAVLSVESIGAIGEELDYLDILSRRGVRIAGLTWNGDNPWASGCFGDDTRGLTELGFRGMRELERRDIVVDVSHLNETGFWDVERSATKPYIATHSDSAAVCPHPRNLTDDQFTAIRDRGGLVGLNLCTEHLGGADFEHIARHLEHFWNLNGEDTVCLGGDLDGTDLPPAWDGVSVYAALYEYLSSRGYGLATLDKLFFENARRFICPDVIFD